MPLTKVSYSMINQAPANVLDYGADKTGVADSTAAFQAAISTGQAIYAPAGTYKINLEISTSNVLIFGDGIEVTIFEPFVATDSVIKLDAETADQIIANFTFRDFSITGDAKQGHGIHIAPTTGNNGADQITITNVLIKFCLKGLYCQGRSIWNTFQNVYFDFNFDGVDIYTDKAVNAWNFISCRSSRNDRYGFSATSTNISGMIGFTFTNFNSEYNGVDITQSDAAGMTVNYANGWVLNNCTFEGNGDLLTSTNGYGVVFQGVNTGIALDGIWAVNSKYPIVIQGVLNGGRLDNVYAAAATHSGPAGIVLNITWNNNPRLELGRNINGTVQLSYDANGAYGTVNGVDWISGVVSNTLNMTYRQNVTINTSSSSQTINNLGSLIAGQEITIFNYAADTANTVTLDGVLMQSTTNYVIAANTAKKLLVIGYPADRKLVPIN